MIEADDDEDDYEPTRPTRPSTFSGIERYGNILFTLSKNES